MKETKKKIGLLGCGAIGSEIAKSIDDGTIPARLTQVYDTQEKKAKDLVSALNQSSPEIAKNSALLASSDVDLVVEAASQQAVKDNALSILQNRKDMMVMSAGALLDETVFDIIYDACKDFNRSVYVPSGAIAGIDSIKAARKEIDSIKIVTTKHPRSLEGAKFFDTSDIVLEEITEPRTIFSGNAKDAVKLFPANVNVAAILSLAGIGMDETKVEIVADPKTDRNTHNIIAQGKFGQISIKVSNLPDRKNPKTSRLAMLSAIECLRGICIKEVKIGT